MQEQKIEIDKQEYEQLKAENKDLLDKFDKIFSIVETNINHRNKLIDKVMDLSDENAKLKKKYDKVLTLLAEHGSEQLRLKKLDENVKRVIIRVATGKNRVEGSREDLIKLLESLYE